MTLPPAAAQRARHRVAHDDVLLRRRLAQRLDAPSRCRRARARSRRRRESRRSSRRPRNPLPLSIASSCETPASPQSAPYASKNAIFSVRSASRTPCPSRRSRAARAPAIARAPTARAPRRCERRGRRPRSLARAPAARPGDAISASACTASWRRVGVRLAENLAQREHRGLRLERAGAPDRLGRDLAFGRLDRAAPAPPCSPPARRSAAASSSGRSFSFCDLRHPLNTVASAVGRSWSNSSASSSCGGSVGVSSSAWRSCDSASGALSRSGAARAASRCSAVTVGRALDRDLRFAQQIGDAAEVPGGEQVDHHGLQMRRSPRRESSRPSCASKMSSSTRDDVRAQVLLVLALDLARAGTRSRARRGSRAWRRSRPC